MNAQQMFERLGFWSCKRNDTEIVWTRRVRNDFIEKEIIFNLEVAKISIDGGWVTKDEMQAINQQCKELGWFEEEKPKYELTKFESDLLKTYKEPLYKITRMEFNILMAFEGKLGNKSISRYKALSDMKKRGLFKNVPANVAINEILRNSGVV